MELHTALRILAGSEGELKRQAHHLHDRAEAFGGRASYAHCAQACLQSAHQALLFHIEQVEQVAASSPEPQRWTLQDAARDLRNLLLDHQPTEGALPRPAGTDCPVCGERGYLVKGWWQCINRATACDGRVIREATAQEIEHADRYNAWADQAPGQGPRKGEQ